jgi:hypothetical protein
MWRGIPFGRGGAVRTLSDALKAFLALPPIYTLNNLKQREV